MKLIDKDALVAEIEKRIKAIPIGETDKRLKAVYGNEAFVLNDLLSFIDSMQEECNITGIKSKEATGKLKELLDNMKDSVAKDLGLSEEDYNKAIDECLYGKEPEFVDDGDLPKEEPVSEIDFEQELYKYFGQVKDFTLGMRIAKRFYEIGRNYQETASEELEKVVEEIVDATVLNAYGVKEIANRLRRTMIESISEEQVKELTKTQHINETCKENGNSLTQELASEDLEKEVYEHLWKGRMGTDVSKPIYFSYDELLEVARHFADWQKQLMMNNAITAEYWDNSLMLDAEMRGKYSDGNKVKLIIIKED